MRRRLRWTPPAGETVGVARYPLGSVTVRLEQKPTETGDHVTIECDRAFTLEGMRDGAMREIACGPGRTEFAA